MVKEDGLSIWEAALEVFVIDIIFLEFNVVKKEDKIKIKNFIFNIKIRKMKNLAQYFYDEKF